MRLWRDAAGGREERAFSQGGGVEQMGGSELRLGGLFKLGLGAGGGVLDGELTHEMIEL